MSTGVGDASDLDARLARVVRQHLSATAWLGSDVVALVGVRGGTLAGGDSEDSAFGGRDETPVGPGDREDCGSDGRDGAARLEALRARYVREAPHERFGHPFNKIVFGEGDPGARLMFIGEAPGADEDASGRPFVGRAGQLLDKMISAMGLDRSEVYIANVLKTRPPNNATPTLDEREASWPYLREQIEIVSPEIIVTLGLPATHRVLGVTGAMAKLRARFHEYACPSGRTIRVMPTYHPAFLLRSYTAENRQKVWSDLQQVMRALGAG